MNFSPTGSSVESEARHSEAWYQDALLSGSLPLGDRMLIGCEGGPCQSRLEAFPPRLEIQEKTGIYVLVDDGPCETWTYLFVATIDH